MSGNIERDIFFEPAESVLFETNIKRSRFIANVIPCRDEETVREKLKEICAVHRQANHNCWGYALTEPPVQHSSDAGEPSGTAGRPILGEIAKFTLVNLLVVVTRYFGGVKLGTRGLIDAYSGAACEALKICPRAQIVRTKIISITFPHSSIGDVTNLLSKTGTEREIQWKFADTVTVKAPIRLSKIEELTQKLNEMSERKIIFV